MLHFIFSCSLSGKENGSFSMLNRNVVCSFYNGHPSRLFPNLLIIWSVKNTYIEVQWTYSKLHIFKLYIQLISFDIGYTHEIINNQHSEPILNPRSFLTALPILSHAQVATDLLSIIVE